MNVIFRVLLSLTSTFWMVIVYAIKGKMTIEPVPYYIIHIALILILIFLSYSTLFLSKYFGNESLESCKEISLADNEFLSVYLGYFFVSLSVPDNYTMIMVYLLVFVFTYLSQTRYFNPIYILFGYHYYDIVTVQGTKIFVIKKGSIIRNKEYINLKKLKRINDTTFIERG